MTISSLQPYPNQILSTRLTASANRNILICLFLRGGADGLNVVVPHGENAYYNLRPTLAIPRPDDNRVNKGLRTLDLDGFFGLHPALAPLLPSWQGQKLAFVQACGTPDQSHSHFEAMELMERGVSDKNGPASGWLGRYLGLTPPGSALRAVSMNSRIPRLLLGSVPVAQVDRITDFNSGSSIQVREKLQKGLGTIYRAASPLEKSGRESLDLLTKIAKLSPSSYQPEAGVRYPDSEIGGRLRQVAQLIKAEVGLEIACIDLDGWDTHFGQGDNLTDLLSKLGLALGAFYADMRDYMERLLVITMTEFGRRVQENASLGTDHGQGSFMMLLGGGFKGRKVYGRWPGLGSQQLVGPGDLAVTTDYRDVLAEVLQNHLKLPDSKSVFPEYNPNPHWK